MSVRDLSALDRDICQPLGRILQEAFQDGIRREVASIGDWETIQGMRSEARLLTDSEVGGADSNPHASLFGLESSVENLGTINSGFAMISGLHTYIKDGGTYTAVSHISGLWVDSHLGADSQVGTGDSELVYLSHNGSATLKNVFYVYGNNKITNFITFKACDANHMVSAGNATGNDPTFVVKVVVVDAEGESHDGYLQIYARS